MDTLPTFVLVKEKPQDLLRDDRSPGKKWILGTDLSGVKGWIPAWWFLFGPGSGGGEDEWFVLRVTAASDRWVWNHGLGRPGVVQVLNDANELMMSYVVHSPDFMSLEVHHAGPKTGMVIIR